MDRRMISVLLLGFGFMFTFTAFQTMGNIEKTVLDSIARDDENFHGDGYTSLAIIYAVLAICNWLAPSALTILGPRGAIVCGAFTYSIFMLSFLWPQTWLLYVTSALLGIGAALLWTGQGTYLSRCSDTDTIARNSGIFWAMLQTSMFFGNLFVYYQFQGKTHIDADTRTTVFAVLLSIAIIGIIFFCILPRMNNVITTIVTTTRITSAVNFGDDDSDFNNKSMEKYQQQQTEEYRDDRPEGVFEAFKNSIKLFLTRHMLLLSITFIYTGLELSFYSGVYSPSIGFTLAFGEQSKQLVGLSGICIGVGEVSAGILFGILGEKITTKTGRNPIVIIGFLLHILSFILIYLNLPNESPFGDTNNVSHINPPLVSIALFSSFLLGFGDASFNTQIYSMLCGVYAKQSTAAFAIFKFTQSIAAAISFVYSSHLGLIAQMIILVIIGIIGTISFFIVERSTRKNIVLSSLDDQSRVKITNRKD